MMTGDPPKDFDDDDKTTLREVIEDFRSRKAVREKFATWGKYLVGAAAAWVALTQLRDFIRELLRIKGG